MLSETCFKPYCLVYSSDVIIAQTYFRCGTRIDITNIEYGGNREKLNYYYKTERIKKDYNKDSKLSANISSNHETLIPVNDSITTTKSNNKQQSNTFGKSTFYRGISNDSKEDYPNNKNNPMKTENIQIKAPLATKESLSDTIVLTEKYEVGDQMKASGLQLCCICRSEDESLAENLSHSNPEPQLYCDSPTEAILSASNTASVIATQYVCQDTQMENQEEKKRSRLQNFFEKAQNKKHGRDKKIRYDPEKVDNFSHTEETDPNQRNKKSKNILRRLAKREPENTSLLKPPKAKYGNKQRDSMKSTEPSDASNLTALSMDTVEIIETEYPIYTELPDSSNDGEVRENLVLITFNVS